MAIFGGLLIGESYQLMERSRLLFVACNQANYPLKVSYILRHSPSTLAS